MSRCPFACPLACGRTQGLSCIRAGSDRPVPANVSPRVRLPGCGSASCRDAVRQEAHHLASRSWTHAGVVLSCPLARPFVSGFGDALHFLPTTAVPAKDGGKSEQHGSRARGGEAP